MGTSTTIGIYAEPEYAEKVKKRAARKGVSISKYLRTLINDDIEKEKATPKTESESPLIDLYRVWRPDLVRSVEEWSSKYNAKQAQIVGEILGNLFDAILLNPKYVADGDLFLPHFNKQQKLFIKNLMISLKKRGVDLDEINNRQQSDPGSDRDEMGEFARDIVQLMESMGMGKPEFIEHVAEAVAPYSGK